MKAEQKDSTANPVGFDLGAAEELIDREEQGIDVEWEDALGRVCYQPDGTTPLTVRVVGSLSKRHRKVQAKARGKGFRSIAAPVRDEAMYEESDEQLGERLLQEDIDGVAAVVIGWSPGFTDKGKPFTYSEANAVRLMTLNPHMRFKLVKALNNHSAFFGARSNGSSAS